jgi:uncharacterized protein YihD (DUF1040 family)
MRDVKRIERILDLLKKLWMKEPDLRFGQMLIVYSIAEDNTRVWTTEDDKFEERLIRLLEK